MCNIYICIYTHTYTNISNRCLFVWSDLWGFATSGFIIMKKKK